MEGQPVWKRALFPVGIVATVIGTLDPLEGSILIGLGVGMIALDAFFRHSRNVPILTWSFGLVACGVAALFAISSVGGIQMRGGTEGLSAWWGLLILPYPVGWLLGIIGTFRSLWDRRTPAGPRPAT